MKKIWDDGGLKIPGTLVGTVILGIISRKLHLGFWFFDKSLGDVLYAVAAYLLIVLVTGFKPRRAAPFALFAVVCVELFKLTGLPLAWRGFWPARWLLGSVFSWHNIVCYAVGAVAISLIDYRVLRWDMTEKHDS
ncbi:MAG: DUF2809 domain-containing protein [Candidatus Ozemobacteraceae bacterium]